MSQTYIRISERDNVAVALENLSAGSDVLGVKAASDILPGHKIALTNISSGESVIKYGYPIGQATEDIKAGDHIHTHNIKTLLSGTVEYSYQPIDGSVTSAPGRTGHFWGYPRKNGRSATRNEIWIINTVGCVNKTAEILSRRMEKEAEGNCDGVFSFSHPFGCSQLGQDHKTTQTILADLVHHPNAGGVLVLGLGCENNNIPEFKKVLGEYDESRVKFLSTQDASDEIEEGMSLIRELMKQTVTDRRVECPVSDLVVGMKCGGSDGLSGITANPLLGLFSDALVAEGGSTILTEVPEMFGAETILMNRCINKDVFDKTVSLINDFKDYFTQHNQVVYENPSPGNKDGGITTLEDKSLGCIQKGGRAPVRDVIPYGGRVSEKGLILLNGPGNDIVSTTALTAAGATVILFTTGRGTPLGAPVPTVKVATNSSLAQKKKNWIDFNAGSAVEGTGLEDLTDSFWDFILETASGRQTRNEENGYREISIFKDGVVL
ncbi:MULTISPECIES: UxaA family hydrolase [unclassified Oceanispirochaeta]|uniref:UxaA family hydrolase n=1 Tax=unclassified Oceanispirochaeta TaxID=2635722 RepID=UPI000E09B54B|nr:MULTISPECIES: altronate dehydratase family protein [unclassified Oceanispirochaeta]MBF9014298.1 altronate dehydratase [Oceanispirochaeta sp. M2]NPD71184.1 altronate dehydratase [Oceanispirochaeta sp. M1]RDG33574.1 altronate dehydratase [Oceanispirochaeta sp. M1]